MFNSFYNLLINAKLRNFDLFNCLDVARKYGKIHRDDVTDLFTSNDTGNFVISENLIEEPVFLSAKDKPETYVVFYRNLFITFLNDTEQGNRIIRIYIKRPEDNWEVTTSENGELDILNPLNVNAEVYAVYDVNVLNISRCAGEEYFSGKWNKMFYKTVNSFTKNVEGYKEISKMRVAYGK